jgi:hypothetical protein
MCSVIVLEILFAAIFLKRITRWQFLWDAQRVLLSLTGQSPLLAIFLTAKIQLVFEITMGK